MAGWSNQSGIGVVNQDWPEGVSLFVFSNYVLARIKSNDIPNDLKDSIAECYNNISDNKRVYLRYIMLYTIYRFALLRKQQESTQFFEEKSSLGFILNSFVSPFTGAASLLRDFSKMIL